MIKQDEEKAEKVQGQLDIEQLHQEVHQLKEQLREKCDENRRLEQQNVQSRDKQKALRTENNSLVEQLHQEQDKVQGVE